LIALKIQQMLSLMEPDNQYFDISGLQNGLDIGTGQKLTPIKIIAVKKQTGIGYWDSSDDSGTGLGGKQNPYSTESYGGNVAQINALVSLYNFWVQRLNDEWGENPETLGQPTPAKKSAEATRTALSSGQHPTEYIYDHFVRVFKQTSKKIVYRLWDMLVVEGQDYREATGIGTDMLHSTFDVDVNIIDKAETRARLHERINSMVQAQMITPSMAERLFDIENPKIAIMYLENIERQNEKKASGMAEANMQMNAKAQQMSVQVATEGKIREKMAEMQMKTVLNQADADNKEYNSLINLVAEVEAEALRSGAEIPADIIALKDYLSKDVIAKQQKAQAERDQQEAQAQQQQAQQQQGQQSPQNQ
jgi:hypothetical protein